MNQDQAQLLWRCARWFRPTEAGTNKTKGDEEDDAVKRGQGQGQRDGDEKEEGVTAAPVVLVHGVFGKRGGGRPHSELVLYFFEKRF